MPTIFDKYSDEQLSRLLSIITLHLSENKAKQHILKELKCEEELYSIAKARVKGSSKNRNAAKLYFNLDDLRFATPDIVADYRASRLKCKVIAEIGCSTGFQSFAFAKTCNKVYAIDYDSRKIEYAKKNAERLGIKNIEFIHGDALDDTIISKLKDAEIIFCDPERLPEESERALERIRPNANELLRKYAKITDKVCLEFPPQIKGIPFDCEKEYLSVNHELNRLNLYFGALKKCNKSVVILPERKSLCFNGNKDLIPSKGNVRKYVYEVDEAIEKAEVKGFFASMLSDAVMVHSQKGFFLSSKDKLDSDYFKSRFEVMEECEKDKGQIIALLQKNDAGKAILRYPIDSNKYWQERASIEKELKGKETIYLFDFGKIYLCRKI